MELNLWGLGSINSTIPNQVDRQAVEQYWIQQFISHVPYFIYWSYELNCGRRPGINPLCLGLNLLFAFMPFKGL